MPKWLENAIFYEIYPQSFYDTNGDGIGDLQGIIKKLDYIKDLGCNALWINPCFESPFHDAGYDVSDYRKIAPRYGTNEDMRQLFNEAHIRGIKVLLDLVPGHTSVEHEWFKESMKSDDNKYAKRYIWANTPWEHFEGVENLTGFLNGISERGTVAVNFFSTQPALNFGFANPTKEWQSAVDSPEALATRNDIKEIMRFWLSMGCDGFRVDMAHSLIKGDSDHKETVRLWQDFRAFLDDEFPESVIISEWGKPDFSLKAGFHMDFLLHFGPSHYNDLFRENPYFSHKCDGDLSEFIAYYLDVKAKAGDKGLICLPSSNHDMARIAGKLTEEELKAAFMFILSMPGAPFIYYGDEIGMRYLDGIPSIEGGYERTGSRTPMQWDTSLNAGFSSAKPENVYIGIDPDTSRPDVKSQLADSDSLLNFIKKLTCIRQKYDALQSFGEIEFIQKGEKNKPLIYKRSLNEDSVYCVFNITGKEQSFTIDSNLNNSKTLENIINTGSSIKLENSVVTVAPFTSALFKIC